MFKTVCGLSQDRDIHQAEVVPIIKIYYYQVPVVIYVVIEHTLMRGESMASRFCARFAQVVPPIIAKHLNIFL